MARAAGSNETFGEDSRMLQACFDDSGNYKQGEASLMAGLVAPPEEWADFSVRWAAALAEPPALPFFKMSNAFALSKEFKGWTVAERDAKVDRLVDEILATNITYGVAVTMDNLEYIRASTGVTDLPLANPFYFLFTSVLEACLVHQRHAGIHEKVDFIFDVSNKPSAEVERMFRQTMFSAPERIKALSLVDEPPVFRDEKHVLPLQAADLVAGQIRSWQERGVETPAMKKLGGELTLEYQRFDRERFDIITAGVKVVQDYVRGGGPGNELQRYMEIKMAYEEHHER